VYGSMAGPCEDGSETSSSITLGLLASQEFCSMKLAS
jgi:hypothetical protein